MLWVWFYVGVCVCDFGYGGGEFRGGAVDRGLYDCVKFVFGGSGLVSSNCKRLPSWGSLVAVCVYDKSGGDLLSRV